MPSAAVATLAQGTQHALTDVKKRFDAYFSFTQSCERTVPLGDSAPGYTYPDASMISDLSVLWSLLAEIYETCKDDFRDGTAVNAFFGADAALAAAFDAMVGEFWHGAPIARMPPANLPQHRRDIWRTFRNGGARRGPRTLSHAPVSDGPLILGFDVAWPSGQQPQ